MFDNPWVKARVQFHLIYTDACAPISLYYSVLGVDLIVDLCTVSSQRAFVLILLGSQDAIVYFYLYLVVYFSGQN